MNNIIIHGLRMTSVEIADMLEKRHDNVKRTIELLAEQRVISLPQIEEVKIQRERRVEVAAAYIFEGEKGKRDSIVVVAQLSPEFTARLVDRWQELERSIEFSKPAISIQQPIEQAKPTAEAVGVICDILRLPDSGKIGMLKNAMAPWPIICNAIPNYSHDAPVAGNAGEASGSTQNSSSAVSTLPISKIVEGWLTARTANAALEKAGLIKTVERVKRGGSIATFKTVTEEGLKYGKNVVDFRNPRETNPHWFASKTEELKEVIKQHL